MLHFNFVPLSSHQTVVLPFFACFFSLQPGGHILITTINNSLPSLVFAKYAAEYILKLVPPGTHDPAKFVAPEELTDHLQQSK